MDIKLRGGMDGIEAAVEIWNCLQIPFIYITAYSDKSTVERATLTFTCGYIIKPISQQNLYVAIQTALNIIRNKQAELVLAKAYEELKIKVNNYSTKLALVNDELKLEITRPHQLESELSTKRTYLYQQQA